MWAVEKYTEHYAPMPEQDSHWGYRELSRWNSRGDAHRELNFFEETQ